MLLDSGSVQMDGCFTIHFRNCFDVFWRKSRTIELTLFSRLKFKVLTFGKVKVLLVTRSSSDEVSVILATVVLAFSSSVLYDLIRLCTLYPQPSFFKTTLRTAYLTNTHAHLKFCCILHASTGNFSRRKKICKMGDLRKEIAAKEVENLDSDSDDEDFVPDKAEVDVDSETEGTVSEFSDYSFTF